MIFILILFYEIHRFTGAAGTMMATQPVHAYQCGTNGSGSLKQASDEEPDYEAEIPTILGQEVNAIVCFPFYGYRKWFYFPCKRQAEIKIKKCLGYFIYNLPTVSTHSGHFGKYCGQ